MPVFTLVSQPHVEDVGTPGFIGGERDGVTYESTVSITYTLWRNPDDHDDPVNLVDAAKLAEVREQLALIPPGRPAWVRDIVGRAQYPVLWEAVRTTWAREASTNTDVTHALVTHTNHVLRNRYDTGDATRTTPPPRAVDLGSVTPGQPVPVDGTRLPTLQIDGDARVYAIGVQVSAVLVVTAVLPRAALPYLTIAFSTRPPNA